MKKSKAKYLTLASVVLSAGILLSACGNSSSASKTYNYVYSSDPSSLNYLAENRATTNDIVTNLVDGLMSLRTRLLDKIIGKAQADRLRTRLKIS